MSAPQIWVDADACPVVIKNILFKAAERTGIELTLVANQPLSVPRAANIRALQVASGYDVADNEIVRRAASFIFQGKYDVTSIMHFKLQFVNN